jgi:hypothetical protein
VKCVGNHTQWSTFKVLLREEAAKHRTRIGAMSVTVIVLSLGLFGIVVSVAYWFAREEQKAIKRTPPPRKWTKTNAANDARPRPASPTFLPLRAAQRAQFYLCWGSPLVFRFNFTLSATIGFVTVSMLTTCASPSRVVWEYYDQCARENPSFLAIAECGRQKRLAECVPNNTCSPEGNMFMEYIDTLVLSVKKKQPTEAEAMRRYTEYKNGGTPSHP